MMLKMTTTVRSGEEELWKVREFVVKIGVSILALVLTQSTLSMRAS